MAKVSVIMPAYNVEAYIGASIESVQAQKHADWELIIADDGSTDETASVIARYADADPRVHLLRGPNAGISVARNAALRHATGDFLALLDSDDLWEPAYLSEQLAIFAAHPEVDIVTGNGWFFGSRWDGLPARPWPDHRPQPTLATILEDEQSIFIMSIMRRRVYDAIGGFDGAMRSNEDYHYWLRAAIEGFRFWRNDRPLGRYRRRDDSLSASDVRMLKGILVVYEKIRPLLASRPAELAILNRQVARFTRERFAAEAREALNAGDVRSAADRLSALYAHSGGAIVKMAWYAAKWTPGLFARAYQLRRARQGAPS